MPWQAVATDHEGRPWKTVQYRKPPEMFGRPRYEACVVRVSSGANWRYCHLGSDRPAWMPKAVHRLWLRIQMERYLLATKPND